MPKQTIVQLLDDFDGAALPEDTEPIELEYDGIRYRLYLSEANEKKLHTALSKYITDAETVPVHAPRGGGVGARSAAQERVESAGHTFKQVKAWAIQKGTYKTAKGEPIAESAPRLSESIWEDYAEENKL